MRKVFSVSFWVIMAIHFVVFMALGIFTDRGWQLLIIFISILAVTMLIKWLAAGYARRHPEKKKLRRYLGVK